MSSYNIFDNETSEQRDECLKTKSNINIKFSNKLPVPKINFKKKQINYKKNKDMQHIQRKYQKK
jgi:hypothetical protein